MHVLKCCDWSFSVILQTFPIMPSKSYTCIYTCNCACTLCTCIFIYCDVYASCSVGNKHSAIGQFEWAVIFTAFFVGSFIKLPILCVCVCIELFPTLFIHTCCWFFVLPLPLSPVYHNRVQWCSFRSSIKIPHHRQLLHSTLHHSWDHVCRRTLWDPRTKTSLFRSALKLFNGKVSV